jgi:hypothetical protein
MCIAKGSLTHTLNEFASSFMFDLNTDVCNLLGYMSCMDKV